MILFAKLYYWLLYGLRHRKSKKSARLEKEKMIFALPYFAGNFFKILLTP